MDYLPTEEQIERNIEEAYLKSLEEQEEVENAKTGAWL